MKNWEGTIKEYQIMGLTWQSSPKTQRILHHGMSIKDYGMRMYGQEIEMIIYGPCMVLDNNIITRMGFPMVQFGIYLIAFVHKLR